MLRVEEISFRDVKYEDLVGRMAAVIAGLRRRGDRILSVVVVVPMAGIDGFAGTIFHEFDDEPKTKF
jgi:hypothetical protein